MTTNPPQETNETKKPRGPLELLKERILRAVRELAQRPIVFKIKAAVEKNRRRLLMFMKFKGYQVPLLRVPGTLWVLLGALGFFAAGIVIGSVATKVRNPAVPAGEGFSLVRSVFGKKVDHFHLIPSNGLQTARKPGRQARSFEIPVHPRPVRMLDYGFAYRKPAWVLADPEAGAIVRIPFVLKNESEAPCVDCPAEGGVPFPMGEIRTLENLRLRDAAGKELAFQPRVLAKWPDGSLKWVAIHTPVWLAPSAGDGFFLEYGPNLKRFEDPGKIRIREDHDSLTVDTGILQAVFSKKSFYLFEKISLDQNRDGAAGADEEIVKHAALTLSARGKEFRADRDRKTYKIEIEEAGSLRVVVKASGWYESEKGERYCQALVRYTFYLGKSFVNVTHTLIYTGYPANYFYGKYSGLKLPANETIDAFGLRIPYALPSQDSELAIGGLKNWDPAGAEALDFIQSGWDKASLAAASNPLSFEGNAAGWIDVSSAKRGLAIALRNFRENYPKAFHVDKKNSEIAVDLWPKEAGSLDLSTTEKALGPEARARGNAFGLAKTHELLFYFHPEAAHAAHAASVAESFMKPLVIRVNPYWVDATGALGRLLPISPRYATEEKVLERLFDWAARQPKLFEWYGMLNFGDTLTWWRNEDEENKYDHYGWHPSGRWGWYNCEMLGLHTGSLLQFLRSGLWKYFEFGENAARHIMDVDTVHYDTVASDPRLKKFLNHEVSRVGSMHRHNGDHWGGRNEEASHTSVFGILLYHYLTGDQRALDVAKEIGEFFLTEPFTYTDHPDIAPHRAMANALWGDVLLFEATGDERYKAAADKIIEIYLRGQQADGSFLENYDPTQERWSGQKHLLYMNGYALGAIMSYHELTQDEEVKEMLLRLVRYLGTAGELPASLHGFAYAYFITGDRRFVQMAEDGMNELLQHAARSSNPILDGLIYEKPIYHRPNVFLYSAPYAFEAIEAGGTTER